ncbi:FMN-binding protein [Alicyclobacillus sacchari]|nr:FMN-binding protein [Alicyclobacillus sacchari]
MAKQMSKQLIAMCTVALGAMYAAGYAVTAQSADKPVVGVPSGGSGTTSRNERPASTHTTNDTATAGNRETSRPKSTAKYIDGTYQGSGSDQIGTVVVSVIIRDGKIAQVEITQCDTHYPQSDIDPVLPNEVIAKQSADVDFVSGATLSSYAFAMAVQQALDQAQNPNDKG